MDFGHNLDLDQKNELHNYVEYSNKSLSDQLQIIYPPLGLFYLLQTYIKKHTDINILTGLRV